MKLDTSGHMKAQRTHKNNNWTQGNAKHSYPFKQSSISYLNQTTFRTKKQRVGSQKQPLYIRLISRRDSPQAIAPERFVGPPSPPCACSQDRPTGAAVGHWGSLWAGHCHSGRSPPSQTVRHFLCVHSGTRGIGHRTCRVPAGSDRRWMGSVMGGGREGLMKWW